MRFSSVTIVLMTAVTFASCDGSAQTKAGSVRASLASLQSALRAHDARTACDLILPYGRDLPDTGLEKALRALDTPSGRTKHQKYVQLCVASWRPEGFTGWERLIGHLSIVSVTTHGDMAVARVRGRNGATVGLAFVRVAGEWRLLFRFA